MSDLVSGIVGAGVGAVVAGGMSYLQQRWSNKVQAAERASSLRFDMARELMRAKLDQQALIGPLNEVPLLFHDQPSVLTAWRHTLATARLGVLPDTELAALINEIVRGTGLAPTLTADDVRDGFVFRTN